MVKIYAFFPTIKHNFLGGEKSFSEDSGGMCSQDGGEAADLKPRHLCLWPWGLNKTFSNAVGWPTTHWSFWLLFHPSGKKKKIYWEFGQLLFSQQKISSISYWLQSASTPPSVYMVWQRNSFHHGVTVTISPLFLELFKNLIFFFKVAIFGIEIPEHRGNKLVVLK